jgi:hypothetical protein
MKDNPGKPASNRVHKLIVAADGAAAGALGCLRWSWSCR